VNAATQAPLPHLVIIDAHAQAFRSFYALAQSFSPSGLPNNALIGFAGVLSRLANGEGADPGAPPDLVAMVLDAPTEERVTFRTALFPAYKAHRNPRPPLLAQQLGLLGELTHAFGITPFYDPDFEADDIIATLVTMAERAGIYTTIHSADKDLTQLVSDKTHVLDTMRGKRYDPSAVIERFGIPAALVPDWLALVGDSSDNIPGVSGLGPSAATKILRAAGSLQEAIAHPERLARSQAVKLLASRDAALLSLSLTRLRDDVPLPTLGTDAEGPVARLWRLFPRAPNRRELATYLKSLGVPLYLMPKERDVPVVPLPTPRPGSTAVRERASPESPSVAPAPARGSQQAPQPVPPPAPNQREEPSPQVALTPVTSTTKSLKPLVQGSLWDD